MPRDVDVQDAAPVVSEDEEGWIRRPSTAAATSLNRRAARGNGRKKAAARDAVDANSRRIRGARGHALQRRRSERLERPNAHLYETGGMRRTHLRGHTNLLKRLLVHGGGFNLGLFMRTLFGIGTPRGCRGAPRLSSRASWRSGHAWSLNRSKGYTVGESSDTA